jgi:hypothetical protein
MRRAAILLVAAASAVIGFELGTFTNRPATNSLSDHETANGDRSLVSANARRALASEETLGPALSAILAISNHSAPNRLGEYSALCAALENLESSQIAQLLVKVGRLPADARELLVPLIVSWWGRRDPVAATAWMEPILARLHNEERSPLGTNEAVYAVLRSWVEAAPQTALEYARQHPDLELEHLLGSEFASAPGSYAERFAALQSLPGAWMRRAFETQLFSDWAASDRPAAFAAASALAPGKGRDEALGVVLRRWAGQEPAEALSAMVTLGASSLTTFGDIVSEAAQKDPIVVAHWLEGRGADEIAHDAPLLVGAWVAKDPAAAFAWGKGHGVSPADVIDSPEGRTGAAQCQIQIAMDQKPKATLEWLQGLSPSVERDQYAELAARRAGRPEDFRVLLAGASEASAERITASIEGRLAAENPDHAQEWASSLEGPLRAAAWTAFGRKSGGKELPELPAGPDRDAFLGGLVFAPFSAPQTSAEAALQISDPSLRRQAFDDAMSRWTDLSNADQSTLQTWLEQADVPADWKQAWLSAAKR